MGTGQRTGEKVFQGIPVSTGVCRGRVFVLRQPGSPQLPRFVIAEDDIPRELARLEQALVHTRAQLLALQARVREQMGSSDAAIFDAQLLVLDDPLLLEEIQKHVRRDHVNVEHAFSVVSTRYLATFAAIDDEYLRERVADMRDVTERILHNLLNHAPPAGLDHITEPCVIVADDLSPSQTALLDRRMVLGFAIDQGSKTSHTAILARSLQIPAVAGLEDASQRLATGEYALLDGFNGLLIIDPTDQTFFEYGQLTRRHLALQERLREIREQPAVTLDGVRITLSANVEGPHEIGDVQQYGADGVGLYRTEYLFLNRDTLPDEEEQYQAYAQVAMALRPSPVILRTLDLGGDKYLTHRQAPTERNPFLGWRAIRISLQEVDMFRAQLRAILRASRAGNVKLMYPMISGVDELDQANLILESCKTELRNEGQAFDENLEVGVMVELPAAVMVADALARRAHFFSIGTNDLIQYTLAVDRMNPKIAHLYEPTHPAVLQLIQRAVEVGHAHGRWVGVCGEMAGDPVLAPLLIGLGADELSAAPPLVPAIKYVLRRLRLSEARTLAEFALRCESGPEVLARAQALTEAIAPGLFEATPRPQSTPNGTLSSPSTALPA